MKVFDYYEYSMNSRRYKHQNAPAAEIDTLEGFTHPCPCDPKIKRRECCTAGRDVRACIEKGRYCEHCPHKGYYVLAEHHDMDRITQIPDVIDDSEFEVTRPANDLIGRDCVSIFKDNHRRWLAGRAPHYT